MSEIEFPYMRAEVIAALRSLADPGHQCSCWGVVEEGVNFYDDLDMNVHILYDDTQVLPDPESAVPSLLYDSEVSALLAVDAVLGQMLEQHGDQPDSAYLADSRWSAVVEAAGEALSVMQTNDERDAG